MRILHIVSSGDAQSIPLELALNLSLSEDDLRVVVFLDGKTGPSDHLALENDPRMIFLAAKSAADLSAVGRLKKAIGQFDPDIVHVHHAASSLWGTYIARFGRRNRKGIRRIILKTEHNDRNHQGLKNLVVNGLTYPILDGVICNSNATLQSLKKFERAWVGERAWTIYNGVDVERVQRNSVAGPTMRTSLGLASDVFCIGTVGRFVPQKNHAALIEGFAEAQTKSTSPLVLVLVGDGPLEHQLKDQVAGLGLTDSVIFTGSKSRNEVYQLLGAFDGFVMASLWEGFCNAGVEALATGLPVAVSDLNVLREVFGNDIGFFEPRSKDEITQAILSLSGMSIEERRQVEQSNKNRAKQFDIKVSASAYVRRYDTLWQKERAGS